MIEEEEARAISRLVERLAVRFPEVPPRRVEEIVSAAYESFDGARVRRYVPLLVEHDVRSTLEDLTRRGGGTDGRWAATVASGCVTAERARTWPTSSWSRSSR